MRLGPKQIICKQSKKAQEIRGAYRFRQGKENNVCKDVWVGTVKIPKKLNANDDVENFEDYALAA